jgi:L-threonylcarbamoyladenylate synthase
METQIIKAHNGQLSGKAYKIAMDVFQNGGVVVFPTDTVYGVGCGAFNVDGIKRIYELKGRHYNKPLPVLLGTSLQLDLVAKEIPRESEKLLAEFWPGPLTMVFKTAPMGLAASGGKDTIAVRVPDHGVVRSILDHMTIPLATTSANRSGHKSMKTGSDVKREFQGKVDLIIDGGECAVGRESSVIDATHYPFTVLREAAIPKSELLRTLTN